MSKLIVSEFVSLNGVVEAPGGEKTHPHTGWTFESIYGEDHYAYKGEEIDEAESLLLGRVTYEGFSAAWPERGPIRREDRLDAEVRDAAEQERLGLIDRFAVVGVVVLAVRGLLHADRPRVGEHDGAVGRLDRGGHQAARRRRRADPGERLRAARPRLTEAGLVDEYWAMVPVLVADGLWMLPVPAEMLKLRLADAKAYESGVTLLIYEPAAS